MTPRLPDGYATRGDARSVATAAYLAIAGDVGVQTSPLARALRCDRKPAAKAARALGARQGEARRWRLQ